MRKLRNLFIHSIVWTFIIICVCDEYAEKRLLCDYKVRIKLFLECTYRTIKCFYRWSYVVIRERVSIYYYSCTASTLLLSMWNYVQINNNNCSCDFPDLLVKNYGISLAVRTLQKESKTSKHFSWLYAYWMGLPGDLCIFLIVVINVCECVHCIRF